MIHDRKIRVLSEQNGVLDQAIVKLRQVFIILANFYLCAMNF